MDVVTAALGYRARGFFCVPIPTGEKGPRISGWQKLRLEAEALRDSFTAKTSNVGIVLGKPSGWLVDVDLDCPEAIELAAEYLPATGAITGRTGRERSHWWYICEGCETKRYKDSELSNGAATTVELRSTGLQTVVGPSIHPDGSVYDVLDSEPTIVSAALLQLAVAGLHQAILERRGHGAGLQPESVCATAQDHRSDANYDLQRRRASSGGLLVADDRPGDAYNREVDFLPYIRSHGWLDAGTNTSGQQQLTRPGKAEGVSATWNGEHFYVFTSSTAAFEPDKGYRPFEVYTRLDHNGDHTSAAAELARQGFGSSDILSRVDLSNFSFGASSADPSESKGMGGASAKTEKPKAKIPVEFPPHLLKVPGFVGQVTQYMLSTAKRPQPVLSLWAALCLQAVLCGRKIRDPFGGRTNLYVMALAESGNGKDHPRQINRKILAGAGMLELEGPEDIASDSGLLSAVAHEPSLLMHLDEVGRLLKSCAAAGSHSSHLYNIATLLLRLYSSAGGMYKGKAYGDRAKNIEIDQPCLSIYGSTVAASFWGSMSSESIADGFLARMIPVIGDEDPPSYLPHELPVPESILMHAQGWGGYRPNGLLGTVHPGPTVVEYTIEAEEILTGWRDQWDKTAKAANEWRPVWVRAAEKACRLALVYVASKGTKSLRIDADAITWACEVSDYTTSLFQSVGAQHIADSEFERWCQEATRRIDKAGKSGISFSRMCDFAPFRSLDLRQSQLVLDKLKAAELIHTKTNRSGGVSCYPGPGAEPETNLRE